MFLAQEFHDTKTTLTYILYVGKAVGVWFIFFSFIKFVRFIAH